MARRAEGADAALRSYASEQEVAERLRKNNPRLRADRAAWLAPHWARRRDDGRWHVLGDPAHKRVNPVLSRKDETLAAWKRIAAPVLWVEGEHTDIASLWGKRYPREDFEARLALVADVERATSSPAPATCSTTTGPRTWRGWWRNRFLVGVRKSRVSRSDDRARHGHRTDQFDRHAARRPACPHGAAPGVSLTTTAKRCA